MHAIDSSLLEASAAAAEHSPINPTSCRANEIDDSEVAHLGLGLALLSGGNVVLGHAMHLVRCAHGRLVAVALLCDDVDEHRPHCLC